MMNSVRRLEPQQGLSVGDIDEISEALGSIKSSITNLVEGHKDTRDILAVINDKLSQHGNDRILDKSQVDALHKRMDIIEPKVDRHDGIIGKAIWLGSLIITGVTVLINWLSPFIGRILN